MYSKIIVCLSEKEDEVLSKQIAMLKERHHTEAERISSDTADNFISECDTSILFISDDEKLLDKAKERGITVNEPTKMKKSYAKAMEMLKNMGISGDISKGKRI